MKWMKIKSCLECHDRSGDWYLDYPTCNHLDIGLKEINQYTKFVGRFPEFCPLQDVKEGNNAS